MTIYFDEKCLHWCYDNKGNEHFLNLQTDYIMGLARHRGYVYLNQIYELLGIAWDPNQDNPCLRGSNFTIVIGWEDKHNRWRIDIN